jgi:hypothetical protein
VVALVTNNGLANLIAAWAAYATRPQYIQGGSGSGQSATANDLVAAVQTREVGVTSQETVSVTGDTFKVVGSVTALSDVTISEVGVFDAVSGGNMDVYGDFAGIDLATGDVIVFSISITAS